MAAYYRVHFISLIDKLIVS